MHSLHPELTRAMNSMLDRIDVFLRESGYVDEPVKMFLAGGMAVHYHCGTRYTSYNDTFTPLHPDHRDDRVEWECIGNEKRLDHLLVFCPVDLAVSKLSRFSPSDQADILSLAQQRLFSTVELKMRASEALSYYVGDARWIHLNLDQISQEIELALSA